MKQFDNCLIEILTEELPPKALLKLANHFRQHMIDRLQKLALQFADARVFATPRRLAVYISQLQAMQDAQVIERKGPALAQAFDANGAPTKACLGFARSCGVDVNELQQTETAQGTWLTYSQHVPGKSLATLLPEIIEQSALALPIPKRMRWGNYDTQFVRPVHAVTVLFGSEVIAGKVLGKEIGRETAGHRFLAPATIQIESADSYEQQLQQAYVMADAEKRRSHIAQQAASIAKKYLADGKPHYTEALLDEVTCLVEWPVALCGQFDADFLVLPREVLVSAMQDHQRYFAVFNSKHEIAPYFITMSNIASHDAARVVKGNERVLRARLSDAAFFYHSDAKIPLADRLEQLKPIVYQAKLGTLYEKAQRISALAQTIARDMHADATLAARAGLLAKADLTTNMVNEFPELQGTMGQYYARHDGEDARVAQAIQDHYAPRFAGDALPQDAIGQAAAIADKLDTLVGIFGINQLPTGDKDPFGLRRAALGILRMITEQQVDLDLAEAIRHAIKLYGDKLVNPTLETQLLSFFQERLKAMCLENGISADIFAAVAALNLTKPLDIMARLQAVKAFKHLQAAEALSAANKRVSNILSKLPETIQVHAIDDKIFEAEAERLLATKLAEKETEISQLYQNGDYQAVLIKLADLQQPINQFFDEVMVMTDNLAQRDNRLRMLAKLRALFLQVADIALLQ